MRTIKELIRNNCASFSNGQCLLLDRECPLISGGEYRGKKRSCEGKTYCLFLLEITQLCIDNHPRSIQSNKITGKNCLQ